MPPGLRKPGAKATVHTLRCLRLARRGGRHLSGQPRSDRAVGSRTLVGSGHDTCTSPRPARARNRTPIGRPLLWQAAADLDAGVEDRRRVAVAGERLGGADASLDVTPGNARPIEASVRRATVEEVGTPRQKPTVSRRKTVEPLASVKTVGRAVCLVAGCRIEGIAVRGADPQPGDDTATPRLRLEAARSGRAVCLGGAQRLAHPSGVVTPELVVAFCIGGTSSPGRDESCGCAGRLAGRLVDHTALVACRTRIGPSRPEHAGYPFGSAGPSGRTGVTSATSQRAGGDDRSRGKRPVVVAEQLVAADRQQRRRSQPRGMLASASHHAGERNKGLRCCKRLPRLPRPRRDHSWPPPRPGRRPRLGSAWRTIAGLGPSRLPFP